MQFKKTRKHNILGKSNPITLPDNWALVLEGGGTRCCYTGGVLDTFLQKNIIFPYVIGVSAGAGKALSYVSGQKGRNKIMVRDHMYKNKYMSMKHVLHGKPYLNPNYVFHEMPDEHLSFDFDKFQESDIQFLTGAFDCEQGETVWFPKEEMTSDFSTIQASTSLPYVSPMMELDGKKLLDGGIQTPIPIEKSIQDGNQFHVIVLTQAKGYRKNSWNNPFPKLYYKDYPLLRENLEQRNHLYNQQVEYCEKLEQEGKALIIRPQETVQIGGLEKNPLKFLDLYENGEEDALNFAQTLREHTLSHNI